jgi:hypothetical protein
MACIERLTSKEHCRTDSKITTPACAANDLIMKEKQSFAKEMNLKLLTSGLLKSMYNPYGLSSTLDCPIVLDDIDSSCAKKLLHSLLYNIALQS